jgi:hypothetical protein
MKCEAKQCKFDKAYRKNYWELWYYYIYTIWKCMLRCIQRHWFGMVDIDSFYKLGKIYIFWLLKKLYALVYGTEGVCFFLEKLTTLLQSLETSFLLLQAKVLLHLFRLIRYIFCAWWPKYLFEDNWDGNALAYNIDYRSNYTWLINDPSHSWVVELASTGICRRYT